MRYLIERRSILRQNLFAVLGICLSFYFGYHIAFGQRSWFRLYELEHALAKASLEYGALKTEREGLEAHVRGLRPESLDPDLLEQQARHMLGYVRKGEAIILKSY